MIFTIIFKHGYNYLKINKPNLCNKHNAYQVNFVWKKKIRTLIISFLKIFKCNQLDIKNFLIENIAEQ